MSNTDAKRCEKCGMLYIACVCQVDKPKAILYHLVDANKMVEAKEELVIAEQEHTPLVTIAPDGTVTILKEGNDKKAAKAFYESLELEGVTLHQTIKKLREALEFYAGKGKGKWSDGYPGGLTWNEDGEFWIDTGEIAREALK